MGSTSYASICSYGFCGACRGLALCKPYEILEALKRFQQAKQSEYHITRLGIFGSTARDEADESSDVDVVVEVDVPDLFILIGIKQDLEEILGRSVDVVRYRDQMKAFLKERIELEAVYV